MRAASKGLSAELPGPTNEDGAARGTTLKEPSSYQSIASQGSLSLNKSSLSLTAGDGKKSTLEITSLEKKDYELL